MQKKVTMILCSMAILACYGCGDDSGSSESPTPEGCSFDAAYCDGNVLHTCVDGVEKTENCTAGCDEAIPKCSPTSDEHECAENQHFDETAGECVDNEPTEHTCDDPNQHYDEASEKCIDNEPQPNECAENQHFDDTLGKCVDECGDNQHFDEASEKCIDNEPQLNECAENQHFDDTLGKCVDEAPCKLDYYWDESEKACIEVCPCNQVYDKDKAKCVESDRFAELTPYQKHQLALKETAMAFYRKEDNIQYEDARRSMYTSPETASSQDVRYLTCSGYVHAVYRQALGIELPLGSIKYGAYGHMYNNSEENKDIIYFAEGDKLKAQLAAKDQFQKELLDIIKPGDAIGYHQYIYDKENKKTEANTGHVVYIYDLIKDDKGNIIDARILHSTTNFEYVNPPNDDHRTTKLTSSLSWNSKEDDEDNNKLNDSLIDKPTGVHEGTVQKTLLSKVLGYQSTKDSTQFVVIRPINKDETYKHITMSGYTETDYPNWETKTEVTDDTYDITKAALCRMQYHDIEIEKTLDAHPGSTVEPGQELTYTIEITNHSDEDYMPIYVTEDLSEYVTFKAAKDGILYNNNKTVAWYIPTIEAGKTKEIKYTVTVKDDASLLGKEIVSTGFVAQIESKEIKNRIAYNLSQDQIDKLKQSYKAIVTERNKNLEAIQKTYQEALSYEIALQDMKLGALYVKNSDKTPPEPLNTYFEQIPYYDNNTPKYEDDKNKPLLASKYNESTVKSALILNDKHALAGMVLNHYYGAVNSTYDVNSDGTIYTKSAAVKSYENSTGLETRTARQSQIYPETLRDGDILIYANTLDKITNEDGIYAYIFLDGKFQGANTAPNAPQELAVKNGKVPEYFTKFKKGQVSMIERFGDMPKIFGKDFYVILRPALTLKKEK